MGRRRAKQRERARANEGEERAAEDEAAAASHADAPIPVLSTQIQGSCMAVAHDRKLWLHDPSQAGLVEMAAPTVSAPTRVVAFDPSGRLLLIGGDDKTLHVCHLESGRLLHSWALPKKISAAAFAADGRHAFFADKFGDVHAAATDESATGPARPLLGHFCSIITGLAASPDGRFLVSCDRDHKIRVSLLPKDPLQGAHEIQSYCLGHTSFVTSCAFVAAPDQTLLASAGGDGTIRLWDYASGQLLDTYHVPQHAPSTASEQPDAHGEDDAAKHPSEAADGANFAEGSPPSAAEMEVGDGLANGSGYETDNEDNGEDAGPSRRQPLDQPTTAALALAASPSGRHVAALVEGEDEVTILKVDTSGRQLSLLQRLALPDLALPTAVQFDGQGRLWVIGRSRSSGAGALKLCCAVLDATAKEFVSAGEEATPEVLRAELARITDGGQSDQLGQVNPQLRKRVYTEAEVGFRKRNRRDIKVASAAVAAQAE